MSDHEQIWLEPEPGSPDFGRTWCQDDVYSGEPDYEGELPTRYVRADLCVSSGPERPQSAPDTSCPFPCGWAQLQSIVMSATAEILRSLGDDVPLNPDTEALIVRLNNYLLEIIQHMRTIEGRE